MCKLCILVHTALVDCVNILRTSNSKYSSSRFTSSHFLRLHSGALAHVDGTDGDNYSIISDVQLTEDEETLTASSAQTVKEYVC